VLGEKLPKLFRQEALKRFVIKIRSFVASHTQKFVVGADEKTSGMKHGRQSELVQRRLLLPHVFEFILL
jgi:hypothetical protein